MAAARNSISFSFINEAGMWVQLIALGKHPISLFFSLFELA